MKWVGFILSLACVLPFAAWLRRNPKHAGLVWFVFGFLPFGLAALPQLDIALIDWKGWPGYVKGALFSATDALALAAYFAMPKTRRPPPFLIPMLIYFTVVLLSALQAEVWMAALFYPWQLLRMFLVYLVVARACEDEAAVLPLLAGLAVGLCFQAGLAVFQRYGLGLLQVHGSFAHQNLLGLVANMVTLPVFALLLSRRAGWWAFAAPLAGCVIAVLTTSRATLGLTAMGMTLVFYVSLTRLLTGRKAAFGLAGAALIAVLSPIAIYSFEARFAVYPLDASYDERAAFVDAARMIVEDHPLGIGANNYVVVANVGGYLQRAAVIPSESSRSAHVHNIYWLTAAELGYVGVAALVLLLVRPLAAALACGWRARNDWRGDLLLGLGISLLIVYVHSWYEWIFFTAPVQYIFAMTLGLVAGLTEQLGYRSRSKAAIPAAEPAAATAAAPMPSARLTQKEFRRITSRKG